MKNPLLSSTVQYIQQLDEENPTECEIESLEMLLKAFTVVLSAYSDTHIFEESHNEFVTEVVGKVYTALLKDHDVCLH